MKLNTDETTDMEGSCYKSTFKPARRQTSTGATPGAHPVSGTVRYNERGMVIALADGTVRLLTYAHIRRRHQSYPPYSPITAPALSFYN
ncbi:hypothetical protein J6590_059188 [Homalodisca vitripennis]|nr:hypothetical protein J6590_059188 [Homalodisca vitripennis]